MAIAKSNYNPACGSYLSAIFSLQNMTSTIYLLPCSRSIITKIITFNCFVLVSRFDFSYVSFTFVNKFLN